jgi:hypothetical protein
MTRKQALTAALMVTFVINAARPTAAQAATVSDSTGSLSWEMVDPAPGVAMLVAGMATLLTGAARRRAPLAR